MNRRLTLLRHSQAVSGSDDRDRSLTRRGRRDARAMGTRLAASGARPSLVLMSPAARARETATIVASEIGYPREFLQREDDLYLASPDDIERVIGEQDDAFMDIVVVGHNPGLTELVNRLAPGRVENVPTSGLVGILLEITTWGDLTNATGDLVLFEYPRIIDDLP